MDRPVISIGLCFAKLRKQSNIAYKSLFILLAKHKGGFQPFSSRQVAPLFIKNNMLAQLRRSGATFALYAVANRSSYGNSLNNYVPFSTSTALSKTYKKTTSFSLGRDIHKEYTVILRGEGNYLITSDGRKVFDASTGAAVSCLGHGNKRVLKAMSKQMDTGITYLASSFWTNAIAEELCKELIKGTEGKMAKVYLTGSGSEAMEAAMKLSRQYFYDVDNNTSRVNYISREGSYHGNTLGALAISGFPNRKKPYIPILMENVYRISSCYPYRQRIEGETDKAFVSRKAAELEAKFQELGPETVIAFIAEPVVGAALGCVPCVPGYLKAMQDVCHKHGALFILDEVMCGTGRTGTLHVWQAEDVVPDIQTMAKGLGGGYQPIAAMLINHKVAKVLWDGSGQIVHGQTYQSMPIQAAAALEVQRIIRDDQLLANVTKQGAYMEKRLKAVLGDHPSVGDIRGRGLFWGIEFVKDKTTKEPFEPQLGIANKIQELAISSPFNLAIYLGTGTADGQRGDHIMLAPSYYTTKEDVDHIVNVLSLVVHIVFNKIGLENKIRWNRWLISIRYYINFLYFFYFKR